LYSPGYERPECRPHSGLASLSVAHVVGPTNSAHVTAVHAIGCHQTQLLRPQTQTHTVYTAAYILTDSVASSLQGSPSGQPAVHCINIHNSTQNSATVAKQLADAYLDSSQSQTLLPSPLWVGIRNSAMTPNIEPRLLETSFTRPHRTQKPQKTTAPDPKKLAHGSPQPGKTMGSPGTLPLMDGHP